MAQTVKHLPTMQETWVRSPGWEDPLEKEMATHSSTLAWKIPLMEEPGGLCPWDHEESDTTEQLHLHFLSRFKKEIMHNIQKFIMHLQKSFHTLSL